MYKLIIIPILFIALASCTSVKKYNENINDLHSERKLKKDVDFLHKKLVKLHPDLYWYISKSELDRKFDSLKASIREPMTSNEFFLRISPVAASVRQGHLQLSPLTLKYKGKQSRTFKQNGTSPFAKFEFNWLDDKLLIAKNYSVFKEIKPGTEIVSVNGITPQTIIHKYNNGATSDGFNRTYYPRLTGIRFASLYFWENGLTDSVSCVLKYRDTLRTVLLKRIAKPLELKHTGKTKPTREEIQNQRKAAILKRIQGIDPLTGTFIRQLSFPGKDSTVAIMKIKKFVGGQYNGFYSKSFKILNKLESNTLILDLRNNPGGSIKEAINLYSYFTDSDFVFIQPPKISSRTSLLHTNYFRGAPLLAKPFLLAFSPLRLVSMGRKLLTVEKDSCRNFYYRLKESKIGQPNEDRFKGRVYLLINGGSFSASCILSSNLKASKRGTFVGEETGGAYNGTVAGMMPIYRLPYSNLKFRFGLMTIKPRAHTEPDGYGIIPDIQIKPNHSDLLEQNDPELNWVLQNAIKSQ